MINDYSKSINDSLKLSEVMKQYTELRTRNKFIQFDK